MNKELEKFATETFRESHNTKMVYEILEDHDINDKLLDIAEKIFVYGFVTALKDSNPVF